MKIVTKVDGSQNGSEAREPSVQADSGMVNESMDPVQLVWNNEQAKTVAAESSGQVQQHAVWHRDYSAELEAKSEADSNELRPAQHAKSRLLRRIYLTGILVCVACLGVGFIVGFYVGRAREKTNDR